MKKYFIAGLIILLPLLLTLMLFVFLINIFTSPFLNFVTHFLSKFKSDFFLLKDELFLDISAKVLIIIALCIFIFILGFVARWLFFNAFLKITNSMVSKIPFIKTIYKTLRDVISAFVSTGHKKAFEKTIMVKFPSDVAYSIGFTSGEVPKEIKDKLNVNLTSVFIPTSPYPVSGYLLIVQDQFLKEIDMSNEAAVKFIVSCGLITPGEDVDK